jgi:hypothetical protein
MRIIFYFGTTLELSVSAADISFTPNQPLDYIYSCFMQVPRAVAAVCQQQQRAVWS